MSTASNSTGMIQSAEAMWTGPGKTIPRTAFVSAYWTHRERLGEEGVNTLRRVREEA